MKNIVGLLTILVGLVHGTYVAIEHWSSFPQLEFVFFVSAGLAQVLWGVFFIKKPSAAKYYIGLMINGGVLLTWILTRTVRAPFQESVEMITLVGSLVAGLEVLALLLLTLWFGKHGKQNFLKIFATGFLLMFVSGGGLYGSSLGMEIVFPGRVFEHTHGHVDVDTHESDMEMYDEMGLEEMMEQVMIEEDGGSHEYGDGEDHPHG